jgi:hypothetical protein
LEELQNKVNNLKEELKNRIDDVNERLNLQTKLNEVINKIQESKDKLLRNNKDN